MREYTTIPNVFRVASLQSVNNQLHHNSNSNSSNNNNQNAYLNNQSNNCHVDNNQVNDRNLQQQEISTSLTTTTTQAIVHSVNLPGASTSGMINDAAIGAESVAIRVNYPHKLTTIASIERQQQYQQHPHSHPHDVVVVEGSNQHGLQSPFATLPRSLNGNVHTKPNTNRQQHDEQRIINTISGSIPSTGFTNVTNAITTLDRSGSLASDLNISLTDFSQLNSLDIQDPHYQNHHHQQQQKQHKYYHHDYPHFQTSRRLSQKPFMELERKNDNGYLWILTPVAAR